INVDETTHSLSPKILDRVHLMRFENSLKFESSIRKEVEALKIDTNKPIILTAEDLGVREPYPSINDKNELIVKLREWNQSFFIPLGTSFSFRTLKQASLFAQKCAFFDKSLETKLNNIIRQKVLPKMLFDGNK